MHSLNSTPLRIAHITDCHVYRDTKVVSAVKGMFKRIQLMTDPPTLVINTGDAILDANFKTFSKVQDQWQVWSELTAPVTLPVFSALGNHDIWIPSVSTFFSELNNPLRGKTLAMQMLNMKAPYYSFTVKGWKFICLYSMAGRYSLGDTQFSWLENELASAEGPICIFSHVPILSIASFMYHLNKKRWWPFPVREMHSDTFRLQALFKKYPSVKLCLAGHVHYMDDIYYGGVRYLCQGAICGNWWRESKDECPAAYAIIDLYEDGSIEKEVVRY